MATKYDMSTAAVKRLKLALVNNDRMGPPTLKDITNALRDDGYRGTMQDVRNVVTVLRNEEKPSDFTTALIASIAESALDRLSESNGAIDSLMIGLARCNAIRETFTFADEE